MIESEEARTRAGLGFLRGSGVAAVLTASVMLLTGCTAEAPAAETGSSGDDGYLGAETSCGTPNDGCPCDEIGETTDCGKIQVQLGDEVQCMMGTRTCLPSGTWGACGGDNVSTRTVKTSSLHVNALGATASICAKNLCDPYCKEYTDTPQGVDAGAGFKVTDAGLTLSPTGTFTLSTCTGLTVTPKTSTTMVLNTLNPTAADKLEFTANLTPAGCYPGTAEPIWTIDDSRSDALTIASAGSTGTLTAITAIAGPVNVVAHVGSLTAQVTVNVNVDVTQVDSGFSSYANSFSATSGAAESGTILYPYEGAVFPLGLPPPIPQWTASSNAPAVKVTLRWVSGATYFKWSVITSENKALTIVPSTSVAIAAAPRYPDIPALAWFDFERSAKGQTVDIAVQRMATSTKRNAEMKTTFRFANSQLRGNVYYQSYGTRLTYNYAGAQDSTGVTFPGGKFGAATMGIEPGATIPKVIAGQSVSDTSGKNCRVCHTASADGSTLITQKFGGSNGASVMVTNLTNATPTNTDITAKTDGTYAWPAIYPTSGFLFGNAGVQQSYGSGPPPGGLDGSNPNTTSAFWLLTSGSLGGAKSATYKTGGGNSKTFSIPSSSWGLQAGVPAFSFTGTKIAMQHYAGQVCNGGSSTNCTADELKSGDKRSLAIMDWNNATNQASNFRILNTEPNTACNTKFHPDATCTDVWPTFLPNDTGLVYEREVFHNGLVGGGLSDFGGTRGGCDGSGICNNDGTKAEIWWINITGAPKPVRLNAANGRDAAGNNYLPTGADSSYCTVSGFYCSSNANCCSGTCSNNRCTGVGYTPLRAPGTSCSSASQCDGGKCNSKGVCGCLDSSDCAGSSTCNTSTNICSGNNYAGAPAMSYVPGHNATVEPVLNYEPTVNPTPTKAADGTTDEFYWVVFTSRRQFGNIATQNPWWSDPRHHDLSKSVSTKKLWVAAVSANPTAGTDPSFPAFYLPGQEWVSGNSKAYWVQNACKVGSTTKSAATVCDTSQDCCAGSTCKLDAPVTSPATRHCIPNNVCVSAGASCSTSSDCCSGFLCSSGTCQDVPPIPSYGATATFTRDFTNECTQGYRSKWGTFEYQGTFPAGTSMTVKVRTADDAAALATATPLVTVGTADTTTTGWTYLPTPAKTVDALLQAASAPIAKKMLRVEITLTPSADATSTPTVATWRMDSSCIPAE